MFRLMLRNTAHDLTYMTPSLHTSSILLAEKEYYGSAAAFIKERTKLSILMPLASMGFRWSGEKCVVILQSLKLLLRAPAAHRPSFIY
jgi:hypothetical protein